MNPPSTITVEIEGRRYELSPEDWQQLDAIQIASDAFHFIDQTHNHHVRLISADPANRTYTFTIDGEIKVVRLHTGLDLLIEKMGLNNTQSKKLTALKAPMPGLVTGIKVNPGQEVDKGTALIILEAMKMENVIVAPHHAFIKDIKVKTGQAVEKGTVLVEFSDTSN